MSSADLRELEAAVGEVLLHLVEESSPAQFSLLLLLIRGALNTSQLRAGNHRVRPMSGADNAGERWRV